MRVPYQIRNAWDEVRYFFNPRQRWLTKKIPNHWCDKDYLWELCILEGIKHHVEQDYGLHYYEESQKDATYPEQQKQFDKELHDIYDMVKNQLPLLESLLKSAWEIIPTPNLDDLNKTTKKSYEETYGEVNSLEKQIAELKTKVMVWAVTNRESIWT